jgi:hypothetical protein
MATSGIDWVHAIFNWAVHALVYLAQLLGISYEEINVWLFCVAWPLVTLALFLGLIILWRDNRALRSRLHRRHFLPDFSL